MVLAWNSARDLERCLDCVAASQGVRLEVIVVDNASGDGSADIAAAHSVGARILRKRRNLGCAGGNNAGWRAARSPFVVFLNPDCFVGPETLARLVEPLRRDPSVGATGGKLYYPDTTVIQHAGGVLFPNAIADHPGAGTEDDGSFRQDRECDYVTGALTAVRRNDLRSLGGFDPEFFPAYYEEADLCERLRRSGKRILFVANSVAYHRESVGVGGRQSRRMLRIGTASRVLFLLKNRGVPQLVARTIPAEARWMVRRHGAGVRAETLRAWLVGVGFALRCLARRSRRPPGIRTKLRPAAPAARDADTNRTQSR